jgi:hypothetical protein
MAWVLEEATGYCEALDTGRGLWAEDEILCDRDGREYASAETDVDRWRKLSESRCFSFDKDGPSASILQDYTALK